MKLKIRPKALKIFGNGIAFKVTSAEVLEQARKLEGEDLTGYTLDLKPPHRSLNANSYLWHLCGEISDVTGVDDVDVYRDVVRHAGVKMYATVKSDEVNRFVSEWNNKGIGWFCQPDLKIGDGDRGVLCFYGSSCYNTSEMARLLDYVVSTAEFYNVTTKDRAEMDRLIKEWSK